MAPIRKVQRTTARHLVFKNARRILRAGSGVNDLQPGYEKLSSYLIPGLQAGPHRITLTQRIQTRDDNATNPPEEHTTLTATKDFSAVAPRFVLPDNAIHSVYPPQGHEDTAEVLPHVTFNDATYPWERNAETQVSPNDRTRTPWLAVLAFTEDELRLSQGDITSIFKDPDLQKNAKQDDTFSISVPLDQLANLNTAIAPVCTVQGNEDAKATGTIFLKSGLFTGLFTKYDGEGNPDANWKYPYIHQNALLAHRRDINSQGMAVAAAATEDDTGTYGIILSNRSGPYSISKPTVMHVHLVNLEGVDGINPWPLGENINFVALPTVYSWTYVCLPPDMPNVEEEFQTLGTNVDLLRWMEPNPMPPNDKTSQAVQQRILARLQSGYSMCRYRTQTGESTVCFIRGPYVPAKATNFQPPPTWWSGTSMTGTDLQILDHGLGIMDITYSAAWQLGRTMAIADQAYTSSLFRLRCEILRRASPVAQSDLAGQQGVPYKSKIQLIQGLSDTLTRLGTLHEDGRDGSSADMQQRWSRDYGRSLKLSIQSQGIQAFLRTAINDAAREVASTPKADDPTVPDITKPYNEFNTPFSVDWAAILDWLSDRLFYGSVPAHYLLTDASNLPLESVRFFNIDKTWMDSFINGALSLGNHVEQQGDAVQDGIKTAFNIYLTTKIDELGYLPPMPKCGCFVRSKLVSKFPDMIVSVTPETRQDGAPILLRHELLDDSTMLCLFSELPSESSFNTLNLTQPPHQQFFAIGDKVKPDSLEITYRKAYTVSDANLKDETFRDPLIDPVTWKPSEQSSHGCVYLWDNKNPSNRVELRLLLVENLSTDYLKELTNWKPGPDGKWFTDDVASSALVGYQCNSPSFQLVIQVQNMELNEPGRLLPIPVRASPSPPPPPVKRSPDRFAVIPAPNERKRQPGTLPTRYPPPTHRAVRTKPLPRNPFTTLPEPTVPITDPANYPSFQYHFWEASNPGTVDNPVPIPMNTKLPQDIIFSIVLDKAYEYNLLEMEVAVPLGIPTEHRTTLTRAYRGSGAVMLSNLRFNAFATFSTKDNELKIQIKPRSTQARGVPVKRCADLSFILNGVDVSDNSGAGEEFKKDGLFLLPVTVTPSFFTLSLNPIDSYMEFINMAPSGSVSAQATVPTQDSESEDEEESSEEESDEET
ncbi:MAG: hypothetical protein M1822_009969 [Bathelium mastoideum]|nr:MAG: hypothetical protein M1822_009969 [Bathelium mastoideum]